MSENAEAVEKAAKKVAKKRAAAKKNGTAKKAAKKIGRKAPAKKAAAAEAPKKRGRPAGKKVAKKRPVNGRRKRAAKQFAYMLLTPQEGGEMKAGQINGPFSSEKDALDDASIMADDTMQVVIFRETKRGQVQKQTRFVAGR